MKKSLTFVLAVLASSALAQYQLIDLGASYPAGAYSSGRAISPGGTTVHYSAGNNNAAYTRNPAGTVTTLGLVSGFNRANPEGVNDAGVAVGIVQTGQFGTQYPTHWQNGVGTRYALNGGYTNGQARAVNNNGLAAGSVGSGSAQVAATYTVAGGSQRIPATLPDGTALTVAYGVNDAGLVVGQASLPSSAAAYRAFAYDSVTGVVTDLGVANPASNNGSIAYAVSRSGFVAGSSTFNGGVTSDAFLWDAAGGIRAVAPLNGSNRMQARGVNSLGWTVGQDFASATAWFNNGTTTVSLNSLLGSALPAGWDLNTAYGISDDGTIIGQGAYSGTIRAFAIQAVPEPTTVVALGLGLLAVRRRR